MICCTICGIDKPESMFYRMKDRHHKQCKRCMRLKQLGYWNEEGDKRRRVKRDEAMRLGLDGPLEPRRGSCRICGKPGDLVTTKRGEFHRDCLAWHESACVVHAPSAWRSSAAVAMEECA